MKAAVGSDLAFKAPMVAARRALHRSAYASTNSIEYRTEAAATEAERAELLAAGPVMLTTYEGTAFHAYYIVGSVTGIIVSAVMIRSRAFGKVPACTGILANVIGMGLYLPVIGLMVSAVSGLIFWVWYILLAHRFYRLGWST